MVDTVDAADVNARSHVYAETPGNSAFELQTPLFLAADATTSSRWLTFCGSTFEQDFVRFRGRGRDVVTWLLMTSTVVIESGRLVATPQSPTTWLILLVSVVFFTATIPLFVIGIACARSKKTDNAARQLVLALRQERFLVLHISVRCVVLIAEFTVRYRECVEDDSHGQPCYMGAIGSTNFFIALLHLIAKPNLRILAGLDGMFVVVAMVSMALFSGNTSAIDYVVSAALLVTAAFVFMCDSYVRERAERCNFVEHATMMKASLEIERLSQDTQAVLAAAMPKELLALGVAASSNHRSYDASVGVCDLADFASWSCGLLIEDVVVSLHDLMLLVDVSATLHNVVNVMSYGDSCVVCAGLLAPCDDHVHRTALFGKWLLDHADTLSFEPRVAIGSGALMGGLVGGYCKRYVVVGPALAAAKTALLDLAPGSMTLCDATTGSVSDGYSASHTEGIALQNSVSEEAGPPPAAPTFSGLWLSFSDEAAQRGLALAEARSFSESKQLMSAIPVTVLGIFLFTLLVELAHDDPSRLNRQPALSFSGTAVALALTAAVALGRRLWRALPLPLDVSAYIAAFLIGSVASELSGSALVNAMRLLILLGCPNLFPRLPWLAQLGVILATISVPAVVSSLLGDRSKLPLVIVSQIVIVIMKYHFKRLACQHYVAEAAAQQAVDAARDQTERYDGLLAGLLPPHAVPLANEVKAASSPERCGNHIRRQWLGLSVLQVQLSVSQLHTVLAVASAWSDVANAVIEMPSKLLETVETSGDSFLVAGPFANLDDAARVETAGDVLALLATLKRVIARRCAFTAVATAGSAFGAMIGFWGLTFRFYGAAIRESNAILAAAPATTDTPLAFATAGFRQQHANFGVAPHPSSDAAMSVALTTESTSGDTHCAVSASTMEFGRAANWRIRGVGVSRVSSIKML
jgi:hypothetical protein